MSEPGCPLWRDTLGCVLPMAWAAQTAAKGRVEARTRPQSTRKAPEISNKKLCDPKSAAGQAGQVPRASRLARRDQSLAGTEARDK
jgi:hypothetical protein